MKWHRGLWRVAFSAAVVVVVVMVVAVGGVVVVASRRGNRSPPNPSPPIKGDQRVHPLKGRSRKPSHLFSSLEGPSMTRCGIVICMVRPDTDGFAKHTINRCKWYRVDSPINGIPSIGISPLSALHRAVSHSGANLVVHSA